MLFAIKPQKIHIEYGVIDIKLKIVSIERSQRKNKKYVVELENGVKIHFGDKRYQHYKDRLGKFASLNHLDKKRRHNYLARAAGIRDKNGKLTINNPESANFYAIRILW